MSETLQLWSVQHTEAWEYAEQKGYLKADGRRILHEHRSAYKWLIKQMVERVPNYDGSYPVWAWLDRPDLRQKDHLPSGTPGVRLKFKAPLEEVLISDFDAWHDVLNDWFCSLTQAEHDDFHTKSVASRNDPEQLALLRQTMEESWQRIFDIELLEQYPEWQGEKRQLQVTLGKIAVSQVERVDYFIAR